MHSTKPTVENQTRASLKETENELACSQLSDPEDALSDLELDALTPITADRRGESVNGVSLPLWRKSQKANGIACNIPNNIQRITPRF
jgi:hypothetical protein